MSTYEKIATALVLVLAGALLFSWSTHEHREPPHDDAQVNFDDSRGQAFAVGPFNLIVSTWGSGPARGDCASMEPVFIAGLHDIYLDLRDSAAASGIQGDWNAFQVNDEALGALCKPGAQLTLYDDARDTLRITAEPSERSVPEWGASDDIGTAVIMNAYLARAGSPLPNDPQASTRVLIPDRFLMEASSSPN